MSDKRGLYAVVIVAVILLLLMRKGMTGGDTTVIQRDGDTINLSTPIVHYDIPQVPGTPPGAWDWMQTTNLSCGCDAGLWKNPVVIQVVDQKITSYPSYSYVVQKEYIAAPTPVYNFPVYTPPPPPPAPPQATYWTEWGWNVHDEPAQYIVTSEGTTLIGGKYSRRNDIYGTYPDQTKYGWTQSGENVYYQGKRFVHDRSHDYDRPGTGGHQKQWHP